MKDKVQTKLGIMAALGSYEDRVLSERISLVTGAASGIGAAIAASLAQHGRVIKVDRLEGDIAADLGTESGRHWLVSQAEILSAGRLDAVYACAGVLGRGAATLSVNFFGATAILASLLPLLQRGTMPRAVAIGSVAGYNPADEPLIAACLAGDELRACAMAAVRDELAIYAASKTALARWVRQRAVQAAWAGSGVLLNVVAPGLVETGMNRETFSNPRRRAAVAEMMPCPLGRHAQPEEVASLASYLGGITNRFVTGQIIYCDGGQEALQRGATVF